MGKKETGASAINLDVSSLAEFFLGLPMVPLPYHLQFEESRSSGRPDNFVMHQSKKFEVHMLCILLTVHVDSVCFVHANTLPTDLMLSPLLYQECMYIWQQ